MTEGSVLLTLASAFIGFFIGLLVILGWQSINAIFGLPYLEQEVIGGIIGLTVVVCILIGCGMGIYSLFSKN